MVQDPVLQPENWFSQNVETWFAENGEGGIAVLDTINHLQLTDIRNSMFFEQLRFQLHEFVRQHFF